MIEITTIFGTELEVLAKIINQAVADGNSVRFASDGGLKVSVAQRMWTAPMGTVRKAG